MTTPNRKPTTLSLLILVALIFSFLFLAGCSSIPFQKSTAYFKDLYRRIEYKIEGRYRVISLFYASAREIKDRKGTEYNPALFTPRIGKNVSYGTLQVAIDPRVKMGTMLPRRLKRKGIIGVRSINALEDASFIEQLSNAVKASPHKSLLVIVFGYKDDFELTSIKASYFAYLLDVDTPVLLFDWPGDQSVSPWGYEKARSLAKPSGDYLGEVLAKVVREVKPEKIWVNGSSLGCQVVCDAFEYMYKHPDLRDKETEITSVFLAAPDVSQDEFDHRFREEIAALSDNLITYVSSNDEALLMSSIIDGEKKVGRQKFEITKEEHAQLEEAKGMLYLKSLEPDKIALVDVTPINKASYNHGYYIEAPEFYDDVYLRLFGKKPHVNRRLYLLKFKDSVDYWVLSSGK